MKTRRLVAREIGYRKLNFGLGALAVFLAAAVLSGTGSMLRGHDARTEEIALLKERETRAEMARLEDDYRIAMRRLGHNVLIVHRDQDLSEMRVTGHPTTWLAEDYAERLGRSDIETLNHLLPVIQQRFRWPEMDREIVIVGMRSQVPVRSKPQFIGDDGAYRNPIHQPVPEGTVILGSEISGLAGAGSGDRVTIRGEPFTVREVYPARGNQDDMTVWAPLPRVQAWLGRPGQVNGIFALECVCEPDDLGLITEEVTRVLPGTRVFEFSSLIRARADVRLRAEQLHRESVEAEIRNRLEMRRERERLASIMVPVAILAALAWVAILTLGNVRERKSEIGILRAVGLRSGQVLSIFLSRAATAGIAGAVPGYFAGLAAGWLVSGGAAPLSSLFRVAPFLLFLAGAPAIAALAALFPSLSAAMRDPAEMIRES